MSSEQKIDVLGKKAPHHETFEDVHELGVKIRNRLTKPTIPPVDTSDEVHSGLHWGKPLDEVSLYALFRASNTSPF